VKFDDGFVLPLDPPQNSVLVNGSVSPLVVVDVNTLYITTPVDISPNSLVNVKF